MGEMDNKEKISRSHCSAEDSLSVESTTESDGRTQTDGPGKEKSLAVMKAVRASFRLGGAKNLLSPNNKGSKGSAKADFGGSNGKVNVDMTTPHVPPSPMSSPLRAIGGLFQKKEGDGASATPPGKKTLARTLSGFGKKDKTFKQEAFRPVTEATAEEMEKEKEKEIEMERLEIPETYTLQEIPDTPLSVMQINELIGQELLEDAHLNLLSLRQQHEKKTKEGQPAEEEEGKSSLDRANEQKDLRMLYDILRKKVQEIVRGSNHRHPDGSPQHNKELLVQVARIIQEEERREGETGPGGSPAGPGDWRGAWREAVTDGVKAKLESVPLEGKEQNASWLAVHLGLLGQTIVEDLENVKKDLRWFYPPSFKVFSAYVSGYRDVVGRHLEKLQQKEADLKDNYALLDWILNGYESERIMGSPSLRPEMESESTTLCLEKGFLDKLKDKFCCKAKEDIRASLDRLVKVEYEEVWKDLKEPEKDDEGVFLVSDIHMDIWTLIKGLAVNSRKVEANLETKVVRVCLEEFTLFPKRFEAEFRDCCSSSSLEDNPSLWADYQITYINSFIALKEHMEDYREICSTEVTVLAGELDGLILRMVQSLGEQYKKDVSTFLRRMMTRKWLTNDEDFFKLSRRTEQLSRHCMLMKPPYAQKADSKTAHFIIRLSFLFLNVLIFTLPSGYPPQTLVSDLHFHVVKDYISQLMKNDYSCKNRKHEKAAGKIRDQWTTLRSSFENMNTTNEWLHPIGDQLSTIIGMKNKRDIKNQLQPLVENYPDISKKHLAAVLYFRGVIRGRERHAILQRLTDLKKKTGNGLDERRILFKDMPVSVNNNDCLTDMPFSCLFVCLPER
ncbi:exocyst complex component 3-like protein 4 [Aplochiton taeniatus]